LPTWVRSKFWTRVHTLERGQKNNVKKSNGKCAAYTTERSLRLYTTTGLVAGRVNQRARAGGRQASKTKYCFGAAPWTGPL